MRLLTISILGLAVTLAGRAEAGVILSPKAIINNTMGELLPAWAAINLINQSGLSVGFISGVTDFDAYMAGNPTHANPSGTEDVGYASPIGVASGILDFDLGAAYTLHRMALWNDIDSQALGAFSLQISDDPAFATWTVLGSGTGATDVDPLSAQIFALASASGRYLRLNATTVESIGLLNFGEIAFDATPASAAAPEPSALALGAIGAIACGAWARRRKAKARP